jgi:hypothetical protein
MKHYMTNFRLRLLQWGIAFACAFIFSVFAIAWRCGVSAMIASSLNILIQDWLRYFLILYAVSVVIYLMTADVLEYFLWKSGRREEFQPVKRNPWNGYLEKEAEPISMEFYEATLQSQIVIFIPLISILMVIFFFLYTKPFCVHIS